MKDYVNNFQVVPSLIGTLSAIGGTALGAPVSITGFGDVLGIVCAGGVQGSTGATITLSVKVQENDSATGAGTSWTDITNEAVSAGSFSFADITLGDDVAGGTTTATWLPYESVKKYAKLSDGKRKRFIRAHATLSGTAGIGPKLSVVFLMGKPIDSGYTSTAVVVASGNSELTKLL